ncbi:hypothetical protein V2V91_04810 [Microbacterium schleiferi]|uniref:Uncharacterized protein n=1 Tax=Microbacterium schleiferi TaxID=69362 RepID=A0ABU7V5C7_9MICO|nr:hypothetical protein [Propionibacterium freudenreichii]
MSVGEQPQAVVEEPPTADVQFVVLAQALLDVREPRADAVLVPLERGQVDGIGEVRRQQFVALSFQAHPVRREVSELLIAASRSLVESCVNLGSEVAVVGFADRDVGVGARDQTFRDLHGHRPSGAGGLLGCPA